MIDCFTREGEYVLEYSLLDLRPSPGDQGEP